MTCLNLSCSIFLLVLASVCQTYPEKASPSSTDWIPATVNGVVVGRSSYDDIVRLWGPPFRETEFASDPYEPDSGESPPELFTELWYRGVEIDGEKVNAGVLIGNQSRLVRLISYGREGLTKQEAITQFGTDYYVVAVGGSTCAPIEPNPGPIKDPLAFPINLVYPKMGLTVSVRHDNSVIQVTYSDKCK